MAGKLYLTSICLTSALIFASGVLVAQSAIQVNGVDVTAAADEATDASAPYIIFSNLVRTPGDRFNTDSYFARPVAGKQASDQTEELYAIRFTPQTDVQAKVLEAAISYLSGDKLVKLGLYDNDELFQTVGNPLPGGSGSTTQIPEGDECCELARVTLKNGGITLTGGTTLLDGCSSR